MLHRSLGRNPILAKLGLLGVKFGGWLDGIKGNDKTYAMVICALFVCCFAWNSNEIIDRVKPNWKWLAAMTVCFFWAITEINHVSEFLYFQF